MDTALCLRSDAKLELKSWPEIIKTAVYLKNRTLVNTLEKRTPYEIFMGEKPNIRNLRLCGSKVFVRVPEAKKVNKWDRKADIGILVGYENVGYGVLVGNKVLIAKHVDIIDENVQLVGFSGEDKIKENISDGDDNKDWIETNNSKENKRNEPVDVEQDEFDPKLSDKERENQNDLTPIRRSARPRKQTDLYQAGNQAYIYVSYIRTDSPENYHDAVYSYESLNWKSAMDKEIGSINKNETYELVEAPKVKKVLDPIWIYSQKNVNTFKARLGVKEFQ